MEVNVGFESLTIHGNIRVSADGIVDHVQANQARRVWQSHRCMNSIPAGRNLCIPYLIKIQSVPQAAINTRLSQGAAPLGLAVIGTFSACRSFQVKEMSNVDVAPRSHVLPSAKMA